MRILLIDDSRDLARGLTLLLEREGYDVTWAATGAAALHFMAAEPFDLIVSDIWLPDMDGFTLVRKLRTCRDTPAIAHTGEFEIGNRDKARAAGFVGHVLKPSEFEVLLATIRRVLGTRAADRPARQPAVVA